MKWLDLKKKLEPSKDWILKNQFIDGSISWDEKGKCDPWDHCECLIALSIYEEWDSFWKGVNWFFDNINDEGLIFSEFQNRKPSKNYYESHHAPYIIIPLLQARLIDKSQDYLKLLDERKILKLEEIFRKLNNFCDDDGYYFWAKDHNGYSDNSLVTATMSIILSLVAKQEKSSKINISLWNKKFDRDGVDRSRFSMDFYYPFLAGIKDSSSEFKNSLNEFYVKGLGVKCVIEEPWVTIAESCECAIAALVSGNVNEAKMIYADIQQFQNKDGIFPTGYQYDLDIFWPDERSTWTNAAVIIAGHAICSYDGTIDAEKNNVFLYLTNFFKSN